MGKIFGVAWKFRRRRQTESREHKRIPFPTEYNLNFGKLTLECASVYLALMFPIFPISREAGANNLPKMESPYICQAGVSFSCVDRLNSYVGVKVK